MKRELGNVLKAVCPDLWGNPQPGSPFALAGFECGDGWFYILLKLGAALESEGPIEVLQVKQKLGGLRVYLGKGDTEKAVLKAVEEASRICEECGDPGKIRSSKGGVLHTSCDAHRIE